MLKTFGSAGFGVPLNGSAPFSLGKPPAVFPGRVATDADLIIAVDRQQTRLALPLNASATSMTVVDPSIIVANCLLSIDTEIVKVTGPPAGNVVPISRAFDGTTAAVHLASALVSGFVDAFHHNTLVSEVEAIEQTLGANLSRIPAAAWLVSDTYKFPAQTPGGNLVVGANVINLAPVPLGINGSNTAHSVYISGGTGTAEAALIIGGTAVSGAASGTLIVQCANTHSGAWTIQSATAGIMEAIYTAGQIGNYAQGGILISSGNHPVYATITLPYNGCTLRGLGRLVTTLSTTMTSSPLISCPNNADQITISDFTVMGPNTGGVTTALNFAFSFYNQANLIVERVAIYYFGQGMSFTGRDITQNNHISDVFISGITLNGIYIDTAPAAAGSFDNIVVAGNAANSVGFRFINGVGGYINSFYTNSIGYGVVIEPGSGAVVSVIDMLSGTFDGFGPNSTVGVLIQPSAGEVSSIRITNCNMAGFQYGMWVKQQAAGSVVEDITVTNCGALGNSKAGFELDFGATITLQNCTAQGNGSTATPGPGLMATGNPSLSNLRITGGSYAAGSYSHHSNSQNYGIIINGGASDVRLSGLNATPNVTGSILVSGVNPGLIIENVRGYNPVGQSAITVGASPFTYTAGSSPETVYIYGGTVSNIRIGATQVAAASPAQISLTPGESIIVTYTAAPTMVKDVH
jgi:hypothetical protein